MARGARGGTRRACAAALLLAAASHGGGGGGGGGVAAEGAPALLVATPLAAVGVIEPRGWRSQLLRHLGTFSLNAAAQQAAQQPAFPLRWTVRAHQRAGSVHTRTHSPPLPLPCADTSRGCVCVCVRAAAAPQDPESLHSWDLRQLVLPGSAYVFHDRQVRAQHRRTDDGRALSVFTPVPKRAPTRAARACAPVRVFRRRTPRTTACTPPRWRRRTRRRSARAARRRRQAGACLTRATLSRTRPPQPPRRASRRLPSSRWRTCRTTTTRRARRPGPRAACSSSTRTVRARVRANDPRLNCCPVTRTLTARPRLLLRPAEYDFWVNVGTNVANRPAVCADKPDAPAYQARTRTRTQTARDRCANRPADVARTRTAQVVVPRAQIDDYGELGAAAARGEADSGALPPPRNNAGDVAATLAAHDAAAAAADEARRREGLHRAARAAPAPTECHALGSLQNATLSLLRPGRPELGMAVTYAGGDACLKRILTRRAGIPNISWVPSPRRITLRLRCDPTGPSVVAAGAGGAHGHAIRAGSGTGGGGVLGAAADAAAAMQLARRVRVRETEMCEYVVEWPTRHACPTPPRHAAVRAAGALVARGGALAAACVVPLLALVGAGTLVTQAWRQRQWLRILARGLASGDRHAWRKATDVMLSKDVQRVRRHSSHGHEI
jgi:hypothetical protein